MPTSPSSSVQQARQAIADRLREIRLDAGMTARAVAMAAGWHESKSSRIEHGRTPPSDADIRVWCEICGAPDQVPDLIAASRAAEGAYVEWKRKTRGGLRRVQEATVPLWERTRLFRVYEPGVVPGMFQTPGYARAVMRKIIDFYDIPDDIDAAAAARIDRQRVLYEGDHRFAVLIEESVLYARLGDAEVMSGQLGHLLIIASLPSVSLGVIPIKADRTLWPVEGFWIFDDEQAMVEMVSAKVTITQPRELELYARTFAELTTMAVYGSAARALITAAIRALD